MQTCSESSAHAGKAESATSSNKGFVPQAMSFAQARVSFTPVQPSPKT